MWLFVVHLSPPISSCSQRSSSLILIFVSLPLCVRSLTNFTLSFWSLAKNLAYGWDKGTFDAHQWSCAGCSNFLLFAQQERFPNVERQPDHGSGTYWIQGATLCFSMSRRSSGRLAKVTFKRWRFLEFTIISSKRRGRNSKSTFLSCTLFYIEVITLSVTLVGSFSVLSFGI